MCPPGVSTWRPAVSPVLSYWRVHQGTYCGTLAVTRCHLKGKGISYIYYSAVLLTGTSGNIRRNAVTAWIVAVAWIVAGDNSCRCLQHKSSQATIHAVSVSINCRRRQFMLEISLMLCTSPATVHAAWKIIIGIYCRHRHILTPSQPIFIFNFFVYILLVFIWLRFKWIFCIIRHSKIYQTKIILKTYSMMI